MKTPLILIVAGLVAVMGRSDLRAQVSPICAFELNRSGSSKMDFANEANSDLSYQSTELGLTWIQPMGFDSSFVASIGFENTEYEFGGEANDLWGDVETISGALIYEQALSGRWSLLSIGFIQAAYEEGASAGDGVTWGAALGGKYAKSEQFNWVIGLAYVSRLEDGSLVLPLLGFEWQVNDRMEISSLLGLNVAYDLKGDGSSVIESGFDFNLTDFRLAEDGADGASRAIRPEGFGWYISYTRKLLDWVNFSVKVTAVGETEFELREGKEKLETYKTEAGLVASAGFTFNF